MTHLREKGIAITPDNLKSPGLLVAAQIIVPPINRSPSVRQTIEFVLPI